MKKLLGVMFVALLPVVASAEIEVNKEIFLMNKE